VPKSRILGAVPPLPLYVFMAWCLVKHRYKFKFTFYQIKEGEMSGACSMDGEMRNAYKIMVRDQSGG
jgi:hypothetical protein